MFFFVVVCVQRLMLKSLMSNFNVSFYEVRTVNLLWIGLGSLHLYNLTLGFFFPITWRLRFLQLSLFMYFNLVPLGCFLSHGFPALCPLYLKALKNLRKAVYSSLTFHAIQDFLERHFGVPTYYRCWLGMVTWIQKMFSIHQ